MDIRDATRAILAAQSPAEWLRFADMYIVSSNQMPEAFVLPTEHAVLRPVIESFRGDPSLFAKYIQAIRDQYLPGEQKAELQMLYRTVLTRSVQQARRARLGRALEVVEIMHGRRLEPDERERVARNLEETWANRWMQFLKSARGSTGTGRLRADERGELLKQFWAEIDDEIERGSVNGRFVEVIDGEEIDDPGATVAKMPQMKTNSQPNNTPQGG